MSDSTEANEDEDEADDDGVTIGVPASKATVGSGKLGED